MTAGHFEYILRPRFIVVNYDSALEKIRATECDKTDFERLREQFSDKQMLKPYPAAVEDELEKYDENDEDNVLVLDFEVEV